MNKIRMEKFPFGNWGDMDWLGKDSFIGVVGVSSGGRVVGAVRN